MCCIGERDVSVALAAFVVDGLRRAVVVFVGRVDGVVVEQLDQRDHLGAGGCVDHTPSCEDELRGRSPRSH